MLLKSTKILEQIDHFFKDRVHLLKRGQWELWGGVWKAKSLKERKKYIGLNFFHFDYIAGHFFFL